MVSTRGWVIIERKKEGMIERERERKKNIFENYLNFGNKGRLMKRMLF